VSPSFRRVIRQRSNHVSAVVKKLLLYGVVEARCNNHSGRQLAINLVDDDGESVFTMEELVVLDRLLPEQSR
jgi:hypothetical protein